MTSKHDSSRNPSGNNPDDIFERACAFQWGAFEIHIDLELPAIILRTVLDETRALECLVSPEGAADLALKLCGAVERIAAARGLDEPAPYDRRKRIGGGDL
jgi:hypothetical protein